MPRHSVALRALPTIPPATCTQKKSVPATCHLPPANDDSATPYFAECIDAHRTTTPGCHCIRQGSSAHPCWNQLQPAGINCCRKPLLLKQTTAEPTTSRTLYCQNPLLQEPSYCSTTASYYCWNPLLPEPILPEPTTVETYCCWNLVARHSGPSYLEMKALQPAGPRRMS
jgi:hypothetical protein